MPVGIFGTRENHYEKSGKIHGGGCAGYFSAENCGEKSRERQGQASKKTCRVLKAGVSILTTSVLDFFMEGTLRMEEGFTSVTVNLNSVRIKFMALGSSACHALGVFAGQQTSLFGDCLAVDTDRSCLDALEKAVPTYCFGEDLFRGFGSGGDAEWVQKHFPLRDERLSAFFQETHVLIILVGLSGGTGSGTVEATLSLAHQSGLFTVVIPLMPFSFEGHPKNVRAQAQLERLRSTADLVLPFYNDLLFQTLPRNATAQEALAEGYRLLSQVLKVLCDGLHPRENTPFACRLNDFAHHFDNKPDMLAWGIGSGDNANAALEATFGCPMLKVKLDTFVPQRICLFLQTSSELPLNVLKTLHEDLRARLNVSDAPFLTSCSVQERETNASTALLILTAGAKNLKTERFRRKKSKKALCDDPSQMRLNLEGEYAQSYWDTPTYLRLGLKLEP